MALLGRMVLRSAVVREAHCDDATPFSEKRKEGLRTALNEAYRLRSMKVLVATILDFEGSEGL